MNSEELTERNVASSSWKYYSQESFKIWCVFSVGPQELRVININPSNVCLFVYLGLIW